MWILLIKGKEKMLNGANKGLVDIYMSCWCEDYQLIIMVSTTLLIIVKEYYKENSHSFMGPVLLVLIIVDVGFVNRPHEWVVQEGMVRVVTLHSLKNLSRTFLILEYGFKFIKPAYAFYRAFSLFGIIIYLWQNTSFSCNNFFIIVTRIYYLFYLCEKVKKN